MQINEEQLVELITREVVKQLQFGKDVSFQKEMTNPLRKPLRKSLIILDDSQHILLQELWESLQKLGDNFLIFINPENWDSEIPPDFERHLVKAKSEIELQEILEKSSFLFLPWISLAVLARFTQLEVECNISLLLTKALLLGMKVKARKIILKPELNLYKNHQPNPIIRRVHGLVSEAKQMGIEWSRQEELNLLLPDLVNTANEITKSKSKKLLTAQDVKKLSGQSEIFLPKGMLITPLARDELRDLGVKVRWTDVREVKSNDSR